MTVYDVAIVGYGPVGRLLALKLGRRGHRVVVFERQASTYPLPRAVHHDDEIGRVLQGLGIPPTAIPHVTQPYDDFYEWRAANGETLLRLDWRGRGPSGWNVSNFFYQPALEDELDRLIEGTAGIEVRWSTEVTSLDERSGAVEVAWSTGDDAGTIDARYVVGADGARSLVRGYIGDTTEDLGYFKDWLVVDMLTEQPLQIEPPAWQSCNPLRPTTLVPGGPGRRRWEFMRLPSETPDELSAEDNVWKLLAPWGLTPENSTMERRAMYTFAAKWASVWAKGRLALAGDSAHLMPPFAGQGMCSGFRDALALEWRLDLLLKGYPASLLDSYGPERAEHVRNFIEFSMELGNVICISDPDAAAERDRSMKADFAAGITPPPRPLPRLGPGFHRGYGLAGTLSIQGVIESPAGADVLLDDLTGSSAALVGLDDALSDLTPGQLAELASLGYSVVSLRTAPGSADAWDKYGEYAQWLASGDAVAAIIRPDFYVHSVVPAGGSARDAVSQFLAELSSL